MTKLILSVCIVMAFGWGTEIVGAAESTSESMMDKEVKPMIEERLSKGTVKGTLMKIDGKSYWVKDMNGKEIRLHVDERTNRDKVMPGDKVKAYVTESGHTTKLQRDE
ncbi:MAG TPA: hypothetical protein VJU54_09210 [Nitrospiraceae bacterium]|nr:hypothetical protein [Nitrospiraceae bacterium]